MSFHQFRESVLGILGDEDTWTERLGQLFVRFSHSARSVRSALRKILNFYSFIVSGPDISISLVLKAAEPAKVLSAFQKVSYLGLCRTVLCAQGVSPLISVITCKLGLGDVA